MKSETYKNAEKLAEILKSLGFKFNGINESVTNYGNSCYIYGLHDNYVDYIKFRVSDHDCGHQRMKTEVLFSNDCFESCVESFMKRYFPELCEWEYTGQVLWNGVRVKIFKGINLAIA